MIGSHLYNSPNYLYVSGWMTDANARLIAAAPELLDVLLDLFERPEVAIAFAGNPNACEALEAKAKAAIAKATGQ